MTAEPAGLCVGFDLDMTLIDTVPGFREVLRALAGELGVELPIEEMTAKLGPPLDLILGPHLADEAIQPAVDRFRTLYPDHAIDSVVAMAGAHDAIAAVRRHGGRVVVVTGKFTPNARLHVDHVGFDVDTSRVRSGESARPTCCDARALTSTSATTSTTSRARSRPVL
jgi:phosphoglycolate phosphatase-like HAD superfamily hydrolase